MIKETSHEGEEGATELSQPPVWRVVRLSDAATLTKRGRQSNPEITRFPADEVDTAESVLSVDAEDAFDFTPESETEALVSLRPSAKDPANPKRKALELLARREHSRVELTRKLRFRGFSSEDASQAVAVMEERGWQDDTRFAESLARSRAMAGNGPVRIRAELRQHKISDHIIAEAIAACEMDWLEHAKDVVTRRFGHETPDSHKEMARRAAFLQRRGFDLDAIRYALSASDE